MFCFVLFLVGYIILPRIPIKILCIIDDKNDTIYTCIGNNCGPTIITKLDIISEKSIQEFQNGFAIVVTNVT